MTTLREAAQQALKVMESAEVDPHSSDAVYKAIAALRAALAEPVQEPVAWMVYTLDGKSVCVTDNPVDFTDEHKVLPLYTAPPQQPLTIERLRDALVASRIIPPAAVEDPDEYDDGVTLFRIEALHRRIT